MAQFFEKNKFFSIYKMRQNRCFSTFRDLEDMYKECHAAIRKDPKFTKKAHSGITNKREGNKITTSNGTAKLIIFEKI